MYGLLDVLYTKQKQSAFESVYSDASSTEQMLMRSVVGEALKDTPGIIASHGSDWILCTLSINHKSPEDTLRVFQSIMRKFDAISTGVTVVNKEKLEWRTICDMADTCLVGLGFFKKHLEQQHKRRGAPSTDYYSHVGALAFRRLGFDSIGEEFQDWVDFIENELALISMQT